MYCKRCDKEGVGNFHRCFVYGNPTVNPMENKPSKNTPLARKLARLYEEIFDQGFPGGIDNAMIYRDELGIHSYRDGGAWVWFLSPIDISNGDCFDFGSQFTATQCAKDKSILISEFQ